MTDDSGPPAESAPESAAPIEAVPSEAMGEPVVVETGVPRAAEPPAAEAIDLTLESPPAQESRTASAPAPTPPSDWKKIDPVRARAARTRKADEHLEKIIVFAREKKEITNDDVEKLLHASDATASRYLTMLVKQGKLIKEEKTRAVKYRIA